MENYFKEKTVSRLKIFWCCLLAASILFASSPAPTAYALSEEQKELYRMGIHYYDLACGGEPTADNDSLSKREKIGQLMFVGTGNKEEAVNLAKEHNIGGLMLIEGGDSLFSKSAIDEVKEAGKVPVLVAADEEGGQVQRLESKIGRYPSAKTLGNQSDEAVKASAKEHGEKMADLGVTVNYAPVVDIDDGQNSIISQTDRAFSRNPQKITDKAGAFAEGLRSSDVTPVFKHFPGHGRADGDSHVQAVRTPHISSLRVKDLKPYESLLDNEKSGVMVGHLEVPGLTEGKPATLSKPAIDLLRNEYKFEGVVFSDEIANMRAIADRYSPAEAVALSIKAGVDMPLFEHSSRYGSLDEQVKKTIDKVEADVSEELIDRSLARILKLKSVNEEEKAETAVGEGCACPASGVELSGENNAVKAYNFLISPEGLKLSPAQASGIIGNMMNESGSNTYDLKPEIRGRGMCSPDCIGIVQWDENTRFAALKAWAQSKGGKDPLKLETQVEYVKVELETEPFNGLAELKSVSGDNEAAVRKAAEVFDRRFERSSAGQQQRGDNAVKFFNEHVKGQGITGGSPDSEGSCDSGGGTGTGELAWPVKDKTYGSQGTIGMCWKGPRSGGRLHGGLDIGALGNTNLPAIAADGGTVEEASVQDGFGNNIVIKHGNNLWTQYSHLASMSVGKGDAVSQGDKIGIIGNTGGPYAVHLHFQVHDKGGVVPSVAQQTLNPLDHLPEDGRPTGSCVRGNDGYR